MCEKADRAEFVDILKLMLAMDQEKRLTPAGGLQHKFVKMTHIIDMGRTNYFQIATQKMEVCNKVDRSIQRAAAAVAANTNQHSSSSTAVSVAVGPQAATAAASAGNSTAPLIAVANAAAVAAAAVASAQQPQQSNVIQPDFSHLFNHYNAMAASQIANPTAAVAAAPYMNVYQPFPVLPYCKWKKILNFFMHFF